MTDADSSQNSSQGLSQKTSNTNEKKNNPKNFEAVATGSEKDDKLRSQHSTPYPLSQKRKLEKKENFDSPLAKRETDLDSALYQSKSSLWSVSSASSSVLNSKKNQNETKPDRGMINSPTNEKTATPRSQVGLIAEISKSCTAQNGETEVVGLPDKKMRSYSLTVQPGKSESERFYGKRISSGRETAISHHNFVASSQFHRSTTVVHEDLPVYFDDIIAEPKGFHTPRFSWNLSHEVFEFTKRCFYTVITLFCAIPFAFVWGVWFSILTCFNVWFCYPLKKCTEINIACFKTIWNQLITCICDPVCQSSGLILSSIKIRNEKHDV